VHVKVTLDLLYTSSYSIQLGYSILFIESTVYFPRPILDCCRANLHHTGLNQECDVSEDKTCMLAGYAPN